MIEKSSIISNTVDKMLFCERGIAYQKFIDLLKDNIDGSEECRAMDGMLRDLIRTVESWKAKSSDTQVELFGRNL